MCSTLPEVKKRFRRLAFLNHPDRGGSSAAMQEILRQYEEAVEIHKSP
jgi:curved DNA-binding protein CbpA